ncbi:MAG: hypothetical protein MR964_07655 [Campylobacter sp.]|uniref:hypothetical protein n=1 Tax=Campylobacter sp. TaxID=205 RepID=UPI002AA8A37E|nr:hypothetical protein [Campylobacter sp.]MCI7024076.1 hypothetical protein [Campylobacter sp.]
MGRLSGSVRRSSATAFQGISHRKASRSFCVSRWAAQAKSAKKSHPAGVQQPADAKQKKAEPAKTS